MLNSQTCKFYFVRGFQRRRSAVGSMLMNKSTAFSIHAFSLNPATGCYYKCPPEI